MKEDIKLLIWGDNRHMKPGEVVATVLKIEQDSNGLVVTIKPEDKYKKEVAAAITKANAGFIGNW